ncbi:Integrin beta-1-binding protein 2 [Perkinsus chesapeaki]|uniref:Integrin beta-1-binding protein 2 n=1 Tax=Perkinsus chesapeaki TaxID=330153 RepID=A0A7J6MPY7_PERCH|nr:Integrin beta-1-binding protein 2 [Perkinsus chesapeaki]
MTDSSEVVKTCRHHGCGKKYTDATNGPEACRYHPGWPVFQDIKKTWTCCGAVKYDWDEFMQIPGCAVGEHTDVKPVKPGVGQAKAEDQAASVQSSTPQRIDTNSSGLVTMPSSAPVRIDTTEKESKNTPAPALSVEKVEEKPQVEMKPLVTPSGKYRCCHVGCGKEYDPEDNVEGCCHYHDGKPVFHDLKKEWSCCGARSYDWDDFMALPKCKTGKHEPKMVKAA